MTLILQNAENLHQWVNDQITDEVFYKEKARIDSLLYPSDYATIEVPPAIPTDGDFSDLPILDMSKIG